MSIEYIVYRNGSKIAEGLKNKSYTDDGLSPNTSYTYQVSAFENGKESSLSDPITVKTDYSHPTEVNVSPSTISINVNDKRKLAATVIPSTAKQEVVWSSTNPDIASVSASGEIQGLSPGTTEIIAKAKDDNSIAGSTSVTVIQPVTGVSLNKTSISLEIGSSEKLTSTVQPSNASNKKVTWSSSANEVCTVSSDGQVTAVGEGEATVTVTTDDGNKTTSCVVTVIDIEPSEGE